jgi:hypothetical protein
MQHKAKPRYGATPSTVLLVAIAGCPAPAVTPPLVQPAAKPDPKAPRKPAAAMFGRTDESGRFLRLSEVKLVDGRSFGWRIRLPCTGPVEYVETMSLPSPGDWTNIEAARASDPRVLRETAISRDGKQTVTHNYAPCVDGWIEHNWSVAHDDPPGEWTIRVEIPGYVPQVWRIQFRD